MKENQAKERAEEKAKTKAKAKNMPFYRRKGPLVFCKAAAVFSGIMVLASSFFSWRMVIVKADEHIHTGTSLFDVIRFAFSRNFTGSVEKKMLYLFLWLLLLIAGLAMLFVAWRDQLRPGTAGGSTFPFDRFLCRFRLVSRVIPPVVAAGAASLLHHTQAFSTVYGPTEANYSSWKAMIDMYESVNGNTGGMHVWQLPGWGCMLLYLGILLYFAAEGYRYVINVLNED